MQITSITKGIISITHTYNLQIKRTYISHTKPNKKMAKNPISLSFIYDRNQAFILYAPY